MAISKKVYIGIGSNKGNRLDYLQKALYAIFNTVGSVKKVSAVYETPAMGFSGNAFLNACALIKTKFPPVEVLEKLLEIEISMGRERSANGYSNRTIDLDILFYEGETMHSKKLVIPHPKIQERRFVLRPLQDIAANLQHPRLKKSISELLLTCPDNSPIKRFAEQLKIPEIPLTQYQYLAIEGAIGAGKTSLARKISEDYHANLILEQFAENPLLPRFYKNVKPYAYPLELSFLASRYRQLSEEQLFAKEDKKLNSFTISDHTVAKSLIFANINLSKQEFEKFRKFYELLQAKLPQPDLVVYLRTSPQQLLNNIKKRVREYEQRITLAYLEKINQGYLEYFKRQEKKNVKFLDVSELDFLKNRSDYLEILRQISQS